MEAQLEKITHSPRTSFKAFRYQGREFDAPWHFHPEYELTYIVNSNGMRYVGDSLQQFTEDDLVLLGPNLPHCWKNTDTKYGLSESLVVQWSEDFLGVGWSEKPEFYNVQKLLRLASRGVRFRKSLSRELKPEIHKLIVQSPFNRLITLLQLLDRISGSEHEILCSEGFNLDQNDQANDRINKIYSYVAAQYHQPITLEEIASLVGLQPEAFCRFFKKTLNKTFFTFLNEYKVSRACKLLIETDLPVTQIGYESGYQNLAFFYKQFQKFINCSPLSYRKQYHRIE